MRTRRKDDHQVTTTVHAVSGTQRQYPALSTTSAQLARQSAMRHSPRLLRCVHACMPASPSSGLMSAPAPPSYRLMSAPGKAVSDMRAEFMGQWDGMLSDPLCHVMVMGTTNKESEIDPAMMRRLPRR